MTVSVSLPTGRSSVSSAKRVGQGAVRRAVERM